MARGTPLPNGQIQWHIDTQRLFDLEDLEANQQGLTSYKCPCTCCHGAKIQTRGTIKKHLRQNGRDPYLRWLMVVWIAPTYSIQF
jgi:cytochrome c1